MDASPRNWMLQAACRDADPELFYPSDDVETAPDAEKFCHGCPVAAECLDAALNRNERGVWGGTTEHRRRRLRGLPDIDTSACGTYPKGYGRHTRAGEKPCDECRAAANAYSRQRRAGEAGNEPTHD